MITTVRNALPSELGTVFALLPHAANQGVSADSVFVAERPGIAGILGAGVFSIIPADTRSPGVLADIFVLPSFRRTGVGTRILAEIRKALQKWGVEYLHTWRPIEAGEHAHSLSRMGFSPSSKVFHFEADTATADALCSAWLARLRAGGRIPAEATLTPLSSADRSDATRLYSRHYGCLEADARRRVDQALSDPRSQELSFALLLGEAMIGMILWGIDAEGVPKVDLWVTERRFRSGWPAIVLLQASIDRLARRGYPRGRFECNEETRATLHFARLTGARVSKVETGYVIGV